MKQQDNVFKLIDMRNKINYLTFILIIFFLNHCSFDKKSGIWKGYEKELERISQLEEKHGKITKSLIYSSKDEFQKEILPSRDARLSVPYSNNSWEMPGFNYQNSLGNLYLKGIQDRFLKKRVGKNKFNLPQKNQSPLLFKNNLIFSDDKGSIFKINKKGQQFWKINIYKKIYKKLYKNLTYSIYNDNLYVADNIGFIYSIDIKTGQLIWKQNFAIPFKSKIKIFEDKIFIIDQDNRILCLDTKEGKKIWDIPTIQTFIKSNNLLGLAISKNGDLVFVNSIGDVLKVSSKNGRIYWTMNSLVSLSTYVSDFFQSSDIVINKNDIIFSSATSTLSINLYSGYVNWIVKIKSTNTPIIDNENIFLITDNGYFVNLNRENGKIVWSTNILKFLKKKDQLTTVSGFIMGSDKIFATTTNGYLIVSSAVNGKVEYKRKIADSIYSSPIIGNGELFILTANSKILGFK